MAYPALLPLMRTPRLPAVDRNYSPADLNGLVRLGERRNLVSARVPSGSARALPRNYIRSSNDGACPCEVRLQILSPEASGTRWLVG